jgi:heme-degrading monooxygenase HmoA
MHYSLFEAVIEPGKGRVAEAYYMSLLPKVKGIDGFIKDIFLGSVHNAELAINIAEWKDADAVWRWRNDANHLRAQGKGPGIYQSWRIRIGRTVEDAEDGDAKQWVVLYYRDSFDGKPADDVTSLLQADVASIKEDLLGSAVYQGSRIMWISSWPSREAAQKLVEALPRVGNDTLIVLAVDRDYGKTERQQAPSEVPGGNSGMKL